MTEQHISTSPLLSVSQLCTEFDSSSSLLGVKKKVRILDGISFDLQAGETLGLAGESGSGKTTLARTILRLQPASSGQVVYKDQEILKLPNSEMKKLRKEIQIVFQNPYSSLNPLMSIGDTLGEVLRAHGIKKRLEREKTVYEYLKLAGLSPSFAARYPHELSGGQRQRVGIARALILKPKLVICDEPVSSLDVSVQAQILNLLKDLQQEFGLSYLFITHNLDVVEYMSDRIAVMYLGRIVEIGETSEIMDNPRHPYTRILIESAPSIKKGKKVEAAPLKGEIPGYKNIPAGCRFHTRCPLAQNICRTKEPVLESKNSSRHFVACHFA